MNDRLHQLLDQIAALEDELRRTLQAQQASVRYRIQGRRVEFEASVRQTHRRLKQGFFHWLVTDRPQNLITGPVIYSMIVPLLVLDLCVSLYQASCFPIYRIAKVKRADYIVFDRQQLDYLNFIQKFHCCYCAYANGLVAYVGEIVARTEQYFCPIKHARKVLGTHARYAHFLAYGEAEDYARKLEQARQRLAEDPPSTPAAGDPPPPSA